MSEFERRQLRYFVAVAEELHFGNAARRLRMSQPPLSQQIAALEETLGVRLFDRTKRSVQITPAGRQFLKDAQAILADMTKAATQVRAAAEGQSGILRIGLNYSAPFHRRPSEIFQHFIKLYRQIGLELHQANTAEQLEKLRRNALDICFIFPGRDAVSADIAVQPLDKDEVRLVAPRDHTLVRKPRIVAKDLRDTAVFLTPWQTRTNFYDALTTACRKEGFAPDPRIDMIQMPFIMNVVAAGQGISFVPKFLDRIRPAGTVFLPCDFIPQAARVMPLSIAYRTHDDSPLVRHFLATTKSVMSGAA